MPLKISQTEPALADLAKVFAHGREQFGEVKAEAFIRSIFDRFDLLSEAPEIGPSRDWIKPGLRLYFLPAPVVIAYRFTEEDLVILRVFHGREDYEALLSTD